MTRFRPQDRVLGRDRIGSDADADVPVRAPPPAGGRAPRQPLEQPKDSAQWLKLFRTRTREDVYGAVETITCDLLDQVEYASQRPYTHMGKTGLWHASFHDVQLIVKRPFALRDPKKLVNDFDDEISALQRHRDLSVVRLLGHCTSEASCAPNDCARTSRHLDVSFGRRQLFGRRSTGSLFVGVPDAVVLAGAQCILLGLPALCDWR
jgi:hypothetical protein